MVVALGAGNVDSEETYADIVGHLVEIAGAGAQEMVDAMTAFVLIIIGNAGHRLGKNFRPAFAVGDRSQEVLLKIRRLAVHQQPVQFVGQVAIEGWIVQARVDKVLILAGAVYAEKFAGLQGGRNSAVEIESDPTEKC